MKSFERGALGIELLEEKKAAERKVAKKIPVRGVKKPKKVRVVEQTEFHTTSDMEPFIEGEEKEIKPSQEEIGREEELNNSTANFKSASDDKIEIEPDVNKILGALNNQVENEIALQRENKDHDQGIAEIDTIKKYQRNEARRKAYAAKRRKERSSGENVIDDGEETPVEMRTYEVPPAFTPIPKTEPKIVETPKVFEPVHIEIGKDEEQIETVREALKQTNNPKPKLNLAAKERDLRTPIKVNLMGIKDLKAYLEVATNIEEVEGNKRARIEASSDLLDKIRDFNRKAVKLHTYNLEDDAFHYEEEAYRLELIRQEQARALELIEIKLIELKRKEKEVAQEEAPKQGLLKKFGQWAVKFLRDKKE